MLLMCLAWSEETMSPQTDMSHRFIEAMRAPMSSAHSAIGRGLSLQWDTEELKQRIKHAEHYLRLHNWNAQNDDDIRIEDNGDSDEPPEANAMAAGSTDAS